MAPGSASFSGFAHSIIDHAICSLLRASYGVHCAKLGQRRLTQEARSVMRGHEQDARELVIRLGSLLVMRGSEQSATGLPPAGPVAGRTVLRSATV